ncbi:MAG TPA: methyltransferase domain-containing protein [Candidatus Dormibacteraeota bacterium]|jgi:SAM-dependent methyltransferase|nr:methyltransferase domain-containing protein [Candidatus Dormibacteraeota bacterium]
MTTDRWTSGSDYDQWMGRWSRLLAQEFLKWLNLPAGLRWLDVCCGSGVITESIAESNAPASVAGVDVSAEQITFARRQRTRPNVTFETGDAMALPFPEASFDVAISGLGLNYIPDPGRGLEEFCRVTRPGGTVAVYVWDYVRGARFLREFWDAATAVDSESAPLDQALRFPICTQEGLRSTFEQARLEQLSLTALDIVTRFTSFDDYWEPLLTGQGSAPNYLATRDKKVQAAICERLRATLPANTQGAIELPARAWAIRGRRP